MQMATNKHLELLHLAQDKHSDANPTPLLEQGANPNIRDQHYHKWTPLHYAVFLNKENFALQLIECPKTKVALLDSDGFSALYWAAKKSTATVIEALLSRGCDPNERDMHGMTALFAAVASRKRHNVAALLSHPAIAVNQVNQFGGSALHHTAFATDCVAIAELLVSAGANLFLSDYEGKTPLHVARLRRRRRVFEFLKSAMAEAEPSWKCDVSDDGWDSATDGTECSHCSDEKQETLRPVQMQQSSASSVATESLSPPHSAQPLQCSPYRDPFQPAESKLPPLSLTNRTVSVESNLSAIDSTDSSKESVTPHTASHHALSRSVQHNGATPDTAKPVAFQRTSSNPVRSTKRRKQSNGNKLRSRQRTKSKSPAMAPTASPPRHSQQPAVWDSQRQQQRAKRLHQNKVEFARKMEAAALSQQARDLLEEQRRLFRAEQELFYGSVKHEYDKLHYQLNHFVDLNKQLIANNISLKTALSSYAKAGGVVVTRNGPRPRSKHHREFEKWFRREIGSDFMIYFDRFASAGFDDLRTIRHILHETELAELGIDKKGHRLHILDKIESYRLQLTQSEDAGDVARADTVANGRPPDDIEEHFVAEDVEGNQKTE